jgi:hypothetical protein
MVVFSSSAWGISFGLGCHGANPLVFLLPKEYLMPSFFTGILGHYLDILLKSLKA